MALPLLLPPGMPSALKVLRDPAPRRAPLDRSVLTTLPDGRLFFAQVREDPALEIAAFAPRPDRRYVVVSSGGCTWLSLLAAGAGQVTGVDLNPSQNHLCELKAAACTMGGPTAMAFLGAAPMHPWARQSHYLRLRHLLGPAARAYWERRRRLIRRGVLGAGVTERFIRSIAWVVAHLVHSPARVRRLLSCTSVEEQRSFHQRVWNTRRWRGLFHLLLNRFVMSRAYHPDFFRHVENPSFARHFLALADRGLRENPVGQNYFLHHMLTGRYPAGDERALPPYLTQAGARVVADGRERLALVDGDLLGHLKAQPTASVDGFSLSNVLEWMAPPAQEALFAEIVRCARPGARLCFRNFVGWTQLPSRLADRFQVDEALGAALIARDRSLVQARFVVATVRPGRRA